MKNKIIPTFQLSRDNVLMALETNKILSFNNDVSIFYVSSCYFGSTFIEDREKASYFYRTEAIKKKRNSVKMHLF